MLSRIAPLAADSQTAHLFPIGGSSGSARADPLPYTLLQGSPGCHGCHVWHADDHYHEREVIVVAERRLAQRHRARFTEHTGGNRPTPAIPETTETGPGRDVFRCRFVLNRRALEVEARRNGYDAVEIDAVVAEPLTIADVEFEHRPIAVVVDAVQRLAPAVVAVAGLEPGVGIVHAPQVDIAIVCRVAVGEEHNQRYTVHIGGNAVGILDEVGERVVAIAGDEGSDVGSVGLTVYVIPPVIVAGDPEVHAGNGLAGKRDQVVDRGVHDCGRTVPIEDGGGHSPRHSGYVQCPRAFSPSQTTVPK